MIIVAVECPVCGLIHEMGDPFEPLTVADLACSQVCLEALQADPDWVISELETACQAFADLDQGRMEYGPMLSRQMELALTAARAYRGDMSQ